MTGSPLRVIVVGRGPVGRSLAAAWRAAGLDVDARAARGPDASPDTTHVAAARAPAASARPTVAPVRDADAVMVAVPDRAITGVAAALVDEGATGPRTVLVHAAGALPPEEVFAGVRARVGGIALCHPLVSVADDDPRRFAGALFAVAGDPPGRAIAVRLARAAGGQPVELDGGGLARYHAAAALVANHTLALVATAIDLLVGEGIARRDAERALAALLVSSARNVERLGLPAALTGPIARGDADVVVRHLAALPAGAVPLYRATAGATLAIARARGGAPPEALDAIARALDAARSAAPAEAHAPATVDAPAPAPVDAAPADGD